MHPFLHFYILIQSFHNKSRFIILHFTLSFTCSPVFATKVQKFSNLV